MHEIIEAHPFIFERWRYYSTAVCQARADNLPIVLDSRPGKPVKERAVTALYNISSGQELGIYSSSMTEGLAGLLERVYYVAGEGGTWVRPPMPEVGFYKGSLRESVRGLYLYPVSNITVDEFVARYKGNKLACYQRARDEFNLYGFDERKHTFVGAFVKDERQSRGKAPRLIRPYTPVFNLIFGCYVYPLEKCLYSAIDDIYGGPTVTKGLNSSEVASAMRSKWDSFSDPVCLVTDMSRFDQHCSVDALNWVRDLCCQALRKGGADVRYFRRLWAMTVHSRGAVLCDDGLVKYKVDGTLNSGLSSTSLVGVTLVCLILRAYCMSVGVRHQLISAGDDTNIIIEKGDIGLMDGISAFCLRAGFTVKLDSLATEFESIDFCQSRPVFDGSVWVMVRNPRVVCTKDLLTSKVFRSERDLLAHTKAIGECGLSLAGGIPILDAFYRMLIRNSGGVVPCALERNGFYYLSKGMTRKNMSISDTARISFYRAFGINIWRQVAIEQYYDRVVLGHQLGREKSDFNPFHSDLSYAFEEEN